MIRNPEPRRRPGRAMEDLVRRAQEKVRRGHRPDPDEAAALMHSHDVGGFLFGGVSMTRNWCRDYPAGSRHSAGSPTTVPIPPLFARNPHSLEAQIMAQAVGGPTRGDYEHLFFWSMTCRPGDVVQGFWDVDWIVAIRWGAQDHYGDPVDWDAVPDTLEDYRALPRCRVCQARMGPHTPYPLAEDPEEWVCDPCIEGDHP